MTTDSKLPARLDLEETVQFFLGRGGSISREFAPHVGHYLAANGRTQKGRGEKEKKAKKSLMPPPGWSLRKN